VTERRTSKEPEEQRSSNYETEKKVSLRHQCLRYSEN